MIHAVVVYDIANNKNRKVVGDMLEAYGVRVNRSVFECSFKNRSTLIKLLQNLEEEIEPKTDSIRCYELCAKCLPKAWSSANENAPFAIDAIYFY